MNDDLATIICAQLLHLESENPEKDISLYINSPGGVVTSGMAIYDTMNYIRPNVRTVCMGQCASMGAILLAGGTAGKRFALPNSRIMIHQPSGGAQGQATDIEIHAKEILTLRKRLNEIMAKHCNQDIETIEKAMERDNFMSVEDAKKFGVIDSIITHREVNNNG